MLARLRGLTQKQAARELGVAWTTIRSHNHNAYQRLGVANATQAAAMMLREGWVEVDEILADHEGAGYTTDDQHWGRRGWLPSPAQRLYLDAFDRLLSERTDEAARSLNVMFVAMCCERGIEDRRRGGGSVDSMLTKLARALTR